MVIYASTSYSINNFNIIKFLGVSVHCSNFSEIYTQLSTHVSCYPKLSGETKGVRKQSLGNSERVSSQGKPSWERSLFIVPSYTLLTISQTTFNNSFAYCFVVVR